MKYLSIEYRDFYDVPRAIPVHRGEELFLFDCPFDEKHDEYAAIYTVYLMPEPSPEDPSASWLNISRMAVKTLGHIKVSDVIFDKTRRASIDEESFHAIIPC